MVLKHLALVCLCGSLAFAQETATTVPATESPIPVSESPCGNWTAFTDQKCIAIFDQVGLLSYEAATNHCQAQDPTGSLLTIKSPQEQSFLSDYIFNQSSVVDNVWLGMRHFTDRFLWSDHSTVEFTNWASSRPKFGPGHCVQMHSDADSVGKWVDEPCARKHMVVCQKAQTWSKARLQQKAAMENQKLQEQLDQLNATLTQHIQNLVYSKQAAQRQMTNLKETFFPIGFTYVQLPNRKSPREMWPCFTWSDVSHSYAGVFFRVEGGNAGYFGSVQEEQFPRITAVSTTNSKKSPSTYSTFRYDYYGRQSDWMFTGNYNQFDQNRRMYMRFENSGGEVRPRNMAVRVWVRIA